MTVKIIKPALLASVVTLAACSAEDAERIRDLISTPTPTPTATATPIPSSVPTAAPTTEPTPGPTLAPTTAPTPEPTQAPTQTPTPIATPTATVTPTPIATPTPTAAPTAAPTVAPTPVPTAEPTVAPTPEPTQDPEVSVITIQERASGFCNIDGSIDENNTGFTGEGFANTDNAMSSSISWSVNVANSGNYELQWRFANGSSDNRAATVMVNGTEQASVDFNSSGAWTNWNDTESVTVFLNAGDNIIRVEALTSGGLANVDYISIFGEGATPGTCEADTPATPEPTATPAPTAEPTSTPSAEPTAAPTAEPTSEPTPVPTPQPTAVPPVSGDCPTELTGWATTNGGTTGGGNATPVVVSNASELRSALSGSSPRVVHFSGTIDTGSSYLSIGSNKTLRGTNKDARIIGGLTVSGDNVIVQNFTVQGKGQGSSPADAINSSASNVWFDHLHVLDGGDGLLDLVNGANRITTSWNKFSYTDSRHSHRLSLLFGNSSDKCSQDGGKQKHTIHHNWFGSLVDQRMPRLYFGQAHIYNNYYNAPGNSYAIGVGTWASALIENNYFKDVKDPHRHQNEYPTYIEASGNIYDGTSGKRDTGGDGIGTMPSRFAGSECHANLPDPGPFVPPYNYTLDAAESTPELVMRCAGPQ